MKNIFFKIIFTFGTVLNCPFLYADCQFHMGGIDLFYTNDNYCKVSFSIKDACSNNSVNKRKIKDIQLRIYNNNKFTKYQFEEGYWLPGNSKFVLKRKMPFEDGCFKGSRKIQVDLSQNYLNSIDGLYLNLKSKKTLKIICPELSMK